MPLSLTDKYNEFVQKYSIRDEEFSNAELHKIINKSLVSFVGDHKNVAIYCNGKHTDKLMADFMFELKPVKIIIDNYFDRKEDSGFKIIRDSEIEEAKIDGVIISSFRLREDIKAQMHARHGDVDVLDIYDEFKKHGLFLNSEYYNFGHPYAHYRNINKLVRQMNNMMHKDEKVSAYHRLITEFVRIKDFYNAIKVTKELKGIAESFNGNSVDELICDLEEIYEEELKAARNVSKKNVLMFCMDGLRRQDLTEESMPKLYSALKTKAHIFTNAYSCSTSTFESLIPAYMGVQDLRSKYYEHDKIPEEKCDFIKESLKQGRNIYFYTDASDYVASDHIIRRNDFQTATQKLWNFLIDAATEENGLFYVHVLYETHYSFPNPYTKEKLVSDGMAMLFDYLDKRGGKLKTNYQKQHDDMLKYMDDVLYGFFERLSCRAVIFADHGNIVLPPNARLNDVDKNYLTCHEGWIRIPLIMISPEMKVERDDRLMSLVRINDMVTSLLEERQFEPPHFDYVKMARSEIYNPDFHLVYKMRGCEHSLLAFEAFIFSDGHKLVIYSDKTAELFKEDAPVNNGAFMAKLLDMVRDQITVYE